MGEKNKRLYFFEKSVFFQDVLSFFSFLKENYKSGKTKKK